MDEEAKGLLLEQLEKVVDRQKQHIDALDGKIAIVLAAMGFVLGVAGGHLQAFSTENPLARGLFYVALLVLSSALVAAVVALWPRSFRQIGQGKNLMAEYGDKDRGTIVADLVTTIAAMADKNASISPDKVTWLMRALSTLVTGVVLLTLAYGASVVL